MTVGQILIVLYSIIKIIKDILAIYSIFIIIKGVIKGKTYTSSWYLLGIVLLLFVLDTLISENKIYQQEADFDLIILNHLIFHFTR